MTTTQKIIPSLWYDRQATEAANLYTSIFAHSRIGSITRAGKAGFEVHGLPEGTVLNIEFEIEGQRFAAMDSALEHLFTFSEAISFLIECETQGEIDYFWEGLIAGRGQEGVCGWLKDRFGLSWQVAPAELGRMLRDSDAGKVERVTNAFLAMKKLDIPALKRAYEGHGEERAAQSSRTQLPA